MNPYQNFLDFFSSNNRERLDGLSDIYFTAMTPAERSMAFDHLLEMVRQGGSRESINGLFIVAPRRAAPVVKELLNRDKLREDAQIAAAWQLCQVEPEQAPALIHVFTRLMTSRDKVNRAHAAFYVPAGVLTPALAAALKDIIRIETETLPLVNAVNKLLECHGLTRESVSKETFSHFYRRLRSDSASDRELAFRELENLYP